MMFGFGTREFFHSLMFVVALVPNKTYGLDLGKNVNDLRLAMIFHL